MNVQSLPTDAKSILALTWSDYEPYYKDLEARQLNEWNIQAWLDDWSTLAATVDEHYWRLYIATTVNTADKGSEDQFNQYIENIQPAAKTAEQRLKAKLLTSGLSPKSFDTGLRRIQAEAEIFVEDNLPLLAEEQKLVTEYNKLMGSLTVIWDGEERTLAQMYPLMYETDRSIRQRASEMMSARFQKEKLKINELWTKLFAIRLKIAENAGMPDYRTYTWKQKFRFDYTTEDCKRFHNAIEQVFVPAAKRVYEKRRQRLEVDTLRRWDLTVDPLGGSLIKPYESIDEFKQKLHMIFKQVDPALGNISKS
jgi:oligoendopeptidase F